MELDPSAKQDFIAPAAPEAQPASEAGTAADEAAPLITDTGENATAAPGEETAVSAGTPESPGGRPFGVPVGQAPATAADPAGRKPFGVPAGGEDEPLADAPTEVRWERRWGAEPESRVEPRAETPAIGSPAAASDEASRPVRGANLMLAVVCWIAGLTAVYEALAVAHLHPVIQIQRLPFAINLVRPYVWDWAGYLLMGLGVLLFSLDAIYWYRRPRWLNYVLIPAGVFILAGVIFLAVSQSPGRRI